MTRLFVFLCAITVLLGPTVADNSLELYGTPFLSRTVADIPPEFQSPNIISWNNAIDPKKTAYASVLYEDGSDRDDVHLLALRVMHKSLLRTGTTRDFVVLLSPTARQSTRDILISDGMKIHLTPELDPQYWKENICAVSRKFQKLWVWSLTQYERVVFLDQDIFVQFNIDELFLCGEFCMVFSDWDHFTDGIIVLKPSSAVATRLYSLYHAINLNSRPRSLWEYWMKLDDWCARESYEWILNAFDNMEAVPLFQAHLGQQHHPAQRMSSSVSVNVIYWYEKYSWNLYRTDRFRHSNISIPALTIQWSSCKPFYWTGAVFFDFHWWWQNYRVAWFGEEHIYFLITRLSFAATLLFASGYIFPQLLTQTLTKYPTYNLIRQRITLITARAMSRVGFGLWGSGWGLILFFFTTWIGYMIIPFLIYHKYAWPTFVVLHLSMFYTCMVIIYYLHQDMTPRYTRIGMDENISIHKSSSSSSLSSISYVGSERLSWWIMRWAIAWEIGCYILSGQPGSFFFEFVVKILVFYVSLTCLGFSYMNVSRAIFRHIYVQYERKE